MKKETVQILADVAITYDTPEAREEAIKYAEKHLFVDVWSSWKGGNFSAKAQGPHMLVPLLPLPPRVHSRTKNP